MLDHLRIDRREIDRRRLIEKYGFGSCVKYGHGSTQKTVFIR